MASILGFQFQSFPFLTKFVEVDINQPLSQGKEYNVGFLLPVYGLHLERLKVAEFRAHKEITFKSSNAKQSFFRPVFSLKVQRAESNRSRVVMKAFLDRSSFLFQVRNRTI